MNNDKFCELLTIRPILKDDLTLYPDMNNPNNMRKILNVLINNELFVSCLYKSMVLRSIGVSMEDSYFEEIANRIGEISTYPKESVLEKISLIDYEIKDNS